MRLKIYGADIQFSHDSWFVKLYPWFIWALASSFIFYEYVLQISPSVMVPDLMRAFHVDGAWLGNLAACYYYAYFLMQIPVGLILDRFTPRNVISCAAAICATGAWVFCATSNIYVALFGRCLIGFGASFAIVGTMKLISIWFPPKRFAVMSGLMLTVGMLGAIVGQDPFVAVVDHLGWRDTMLFASVLGYALAILIWVFVFTPARKVSMDEMHAYQDHWLTGLKAIMKNPQCWITAIYSGLAFAPITSFAGLWGIPFLEQQYRHLGPTDIAAVISLVFLGLAIAAPMAGWITDKMQRRKPVMFVGTLIGLVCLAAVIYLPTLSEWMLGTLLLGFGFFVGLFFVSFPIMKEINLPGHTGIAMGFTNMFNALFGALMEPVIGHLLDLGWGGYSVDGARIYSVADFHHAFVVLLVILGLAFALLFMIKETYCRPIGELVVS